MADVQSQDRDQTATAPSDADSDQATTTTDTAAQTPVEDLLVEEVSIDGMCGVY
jgi:mycofactocin precursor